MLSRIEIFPTMCQRISDLLLPMRLGASKALLSIQYQFANCGRILDSEVEQE